MVLYGRRVGPSLFGENREDVLAQLEQQLELVTTDYDVEETDAPEPTRRGRSRVRTPNQARPTSHCDCRAPIRKRSYRLARRLDNAKDLLHLREEGEELEVNDICPDSSGCFGHLFAKEQSRQLWENFMSKSEEEQHEVLECQLKDRCPPAESMQQSPAQSIRRITRKVRTALRHHKKRIAPLLTELENDLSESFLDCPDGVIVLKLDSSFDRLLVHAVSQFLSLDSSSEDVSGQRLTQVESSKTFALPSVPLANCLAHL